MLPEPAAFEMNLTLGSSWPTYQPLSMNRAAFLPGRRSTGSVHSPRIAGRTDLYFGLQPLQSSSFTAFGAIPADPPPTRVADAGPARASWPMTTATAGGTSAARHAGRRNALGT